MEKKNASIRDTLVMLWPSIKPLRWYFVLFVLLAAASTGVALAEPYLYGSLVDALIALSTRATAASDAFAALAPYLVLWTAIVVAETALSAAFTYAVWKFGNQWQGWFMQAMYERMLRLDVRRFQEERAGEMLRKFDNTWEALWTLNTFILRTSLAALFTIGIGLALGLSIDWRLTVVSLVPLPILIGLGFYNYKKTEKEQHEAHKLWEEISGHTGDSFANIGTVKGFAGETRVVKKFSTLFREALDRQLHVNKKWAITEAGSGGVYLLGRLCIFAVGAWYVVQGQTTVGRMIMFLGLSTYILNSLQAALNVLPEVTRHLVRIRRTAALWAEVPDIQERPDAVTLKDIHGDVAFEDVKFSYRSGAEVLRGVSFTIPAGKTVALIGGSGAGKSTLSNMLMRFYDPTGGRITLDGHDLRDIKLKSLRQNVGFVMQENILFNDTILGNLKFGRPDATEKEVITACKRAQAHDFISGLKDGYNTAVGERGLKLSGGQKQRIALARVLLADPPILVLDEATSALDSKTEHDLQAALKEVMKDRTTLVIAHRLSTVLSADNIVVLEKGRVVDQGKHEDLIKRGGLYKQYWEIQAGGYV